MTFHPSHICLVYLITRAMEVHKDVSEKFRRTLLAVRHLPFYSVIYVLVNKLTTCRIRVSQE